MRCNTAPRFWCVRPRAIVARLGALILDAIFLYYAVRMQFDHDDELAMTTFRYSIVYLSLLFVFFFLDHYSNALLRIAAT